MNIEIGINLPILISMIINFVVVFFILHKFAHKGIISSLQERKRLIKKLENADEEYQNIIDSAQKKSEELVKEGVEKKNKIIAEASAIAESHAEEKKEKADREAEKIITTAEQRAKLIEQELEYNFEKGVKATTQVVVNKLLKKETNLQEEYINQLIKEVTKK